MSKKEQQPIFIMGIDPPGQTHATLVTGWLQPNGKVTDIQRWPEEPTSLPRVMQKLREMGATKWLLGR